MYRRVSALMGRSGEDFHSPDMQAEAMRRTIATAGLQEVGIVDDIDVSGRTFSRKGLDQIRAMVEQRQVDVVAVYDLSRLGRNLSEALTFIKWLREHGVTVLSTQERIDESPEGQYMLGQFLGLAELYSAQIGRRWSEIIARRARRGQTHGPTALGYLRDRKGDLIEDPGLGPAVRQAFTAYAAGNRIADIVEDFTAIYGRPIARNTIKSMFRNSVYRGRVTLQSKAAGVVDVPGSHPRLVDDDTWELVEQRLMADAVAPAQHLAPMYSLTGLTECAHCGRALHVNTNLEFAPGTRERIRVKRLVCGYSRATGGCEGIGTPQYAPIEVAVLDEVLRYVQHLRDDRPASQRGGASLPAALDPESLKQKLDRTRDAMTKMTELWARGGVPDASYEENVERFRAEEAELLARWRAAQNPAREPPRAQVLDLAGKLLELWPNLLPHERNRALRAVVLRVVMRRADRWREPGPDRITAIEFRYPHGYDPQSD